MKEIDSLHSKPLSKRKRQRIMKTDGNMTSGVNGGQMGSILHLIDENNNKTHCCEILNKVNNKNINDVGKTRYVVCLNRLRN